MSDIAQPDPVQRLSMVRVQSESPEVLVADEPIVKVCGEDLELLKSRSLANERKRIRLCAHFSVDDKLHEMLIVHTKDAYVRPHKHLNKSESVHVIEGLVDIVIFDDSGEVGDVISMGDLSSGHPFFYRMQKAFFHTLLIRSDILVFHETTNGPFKREETQFSSWAPEEADVEARIAFIELVEQKIRQFFSNSQE